MSRICKTCGSVIPDGKLFCPKCGAEVNLVPDFESLDMQREKQRREAMKEKEELDQQHSSGRFSSGVHAAHIVLLIIIIAAVCGLGYLSLKMLNNKHDDTPEFQKLQAQASYNEGDYAKSLMFCEKARKTLTGDDELDLLYASALIYTGNLTEAVSILRDIIERVDSIDAYHMLIPLYEEAGDYSAIAQLIKETRHKDLFNEYVNYLASEPDMSLTSGLTYEYGTWLEMSVDQGDIYYTIDGSIPDEQSVHYDGPILLQAGTIRINAVTINSFGVRSAIVSGMFTITAPAAEAPQLITPIPGQNSETADERSEETDDDEEADTQEDYDSDEYDNSDDEGDHEESPDDDEDTSYDEDRDETADDNEMADDSDTADDEGGEDWQDALPFDNARAE